MNDADRPKDAINSSFVVEVIDMNGVAQKVIYKTYELIGGKTTKVTRIQKLWLYSVFYNNLKLN